MKFWNFFWNDIEISFFKILIWLFKFKKSELTFKNTREINKSNMHCNNLLPKMHVDPQTYEVFANEELLTCEPVSEVPLAQRYLLL